MDQRASALSPINISLWMLSFRYEMHHEKINNIQKGLNFTVVGNTQAPQYSKRLQCTFHSFLPP
jgi:hypothetical protein